MAFAPFHLLAGNEAAHPTFFGGLDALTIDNRRARSHLFARRLPNFPAQGVVDLPPRAVVLPLSEVAVDRVEGWEVVRQIIPLAACMQHVEYGVDNLAQIDAPFPAARSCGRQQRLEHLLFGIGQVRRVRFALLEHVPILHSG